MTLSGTISNTGYVTKDSTHFVAGTDYSTLANTIGLTADKILTGKCKRAFKFSKSIACIEKL